MTRPIPPYPDELVGSWLIRVCRHLGVHRNQVSQYWNKEPKLVRSFLFLPQPNQLFSLSGLSKIQLLLDHTPIRYMTSCMDAIDRLRIISKQLEEASYRDSSKGRSAFVQSVTTGVKTLRYCPVCVEQDLHQHGEAYWRREHHLPLSYLCMDHLEPLRRTTIYLSNQKNVSGCTTFDGFTSLPNEVHGEAYFPDIPARYVHQFAIKNKRLLNQDPSFEFLRQQIVKYRTQAFSIGFGVKGKDIDSKSFNSTFIKTIPEHVLRDSGVASPVTGWPSQLLNLRLANTLPLKHVLVSTLLDFEIAPEPNRRQLRKSKISLFKRR